MVLKAFSKSRVARFGGVIHPDPGRLDNSVGPVFDPHPELSHLLEDPVDFAFNILVVEDEFPDQSPNDLAHRNRADAPKLLLEGAPASQGAMLVGALPAAREEQIFPSAVVKLFSSLCSGASRASTRCCALIPDAPGAVPLGKERMAEMMSF